MTKKIVEHNIPNEYIKLSEIVSINQKPEKKLTALEDIKHILGINNGTLLAQEHQLEKIGLICICLTKSFLRIKIKNSIPINK